MDKKIKTLLISAITLCVCTALIVGGTYALFTGEVIVNNHLQAGNLTVGLYRTAYTEKTLNTDGYLEETVVQKQDDKIDSNDVNLKENPKELFVVSGAVPQSYYEATLDVVNKGTVAFSYGMRILLTEGADTALAEQIRITVTYGDLQTKSFMLNEYAANDVDLGVLTTGQSGRFSVKAEFIDYGADVNNINNNAQNQSVKFDVQVYATQKVSL